MWEQNLSLRLFSVGDKGKNNRWWMLREIQNKHSNTLKQMKNLSYCENGHYTEAECPHRLWSFHSWRYPNSKWTQSWVTSPCGSELWGWTPCPSNSVSSHLARLWITDLLWQALFIDFFVFCSHFSFYYRGFGVSLLCMWWPPIPNGCFQAFLLKEALCCDCFSAWNHLCFNIPHCLTHP